MTNLPTSEELKQKEKELENRFSDKIRNNLIFFLSIAVDQSSEGIAMSDLEGNLEYVNKAFADKHGYAPNELIGKNLSIFHTHQQLPSVEQANRQLRKTGVFKGEIWHLRRDNSVFPALMHNYNTDITDGLYPYYCQSNDSSTHTINANEYVEVRMVFGAETDERFDWTRFDVLSPTYSCVGFDPPLDTVAIQVRNNKRVLPFKAKLVDEAGNPVTDINPPMLECNNIGGGGSTPVPVEDFLPAGKGTDGNQFEPTGDGWQYNLKLWNFGASTYECYMIPGDGYEIDPSCTVDVEVQD